MSPPVENLAKAVLVMCCISLVWVSCQRVPTPQTAAMPRSGEEQKRKYQEEQERLAAFEKDMSRRGEQLLAELRARPKREAGRRMRVTRCERYFLYYDFDFMNSDFVRRQMFYFPRALRKGGVPFGFTVSYTPPDADVEWIDEVETGTYTLPHRKQLYVHSRGRKIPRAKVVPVPYQHSYGYHDEIFIRGVSYGAGDEYEYVE